MDQDAGDDCGHMKKIPSTAASVRLLTYSRKFPAGRSGKTELRVI